MGKLYFSQEFNFHLVPHFWQIEHFIGATVLSDSVTKNIMVHKVEIS